MQYDTIRHKFTRPTSARAPCGGGVFDVLRMQLSISEHTLSVLKHKVFCTLHCLFLTRDVGGDTRLCSFSVTFRESQGTEA